MKIQLTILVLIFSALNTFSQNTFFKVLPSPELDAIYSVVETVNQDFILCGNKATMPDDNFSNALLLKIDNKGNITNQMVLKSNKIESMFSTMRVLENNNKRFFLAGKQDSITQEASYNFIKMWECDDEFNFYREFEVGLGDSIVNTPVDFINQNDSLIFIVSAARYPNHELPDLSLMKLNLITDSSAYYIPPQYSFKVPSGFIVDKINNQLKIAYFGGSIKERGAIKIASFDSELNFLTFFEPDHQFISSAGFSVSGDSSFILSGTVFTEQGYKNLVVFNYGLEDNTLIDSIEIRSHPDTLVNPGYGTSILVTDSCTWVVGIYNKKPEQGFWQYDPTWIQLNRLNKSFELIEQRYYGGDASYSPYNIISTSDGGILIVGIRNERNATPVPFQQDPFVLKLNSDGLIVNIDNPPQSIAQEAIVLPNPGNEFLQVKLAIQHKSAHIQLYDINGRFVLESDLIGDLHKVSTNNLGSGTYIYRITASNRIIGSGKWLKQ